MEGLLVSRSVVGSNLVLGKRSYLPCSCRASWSPINNEYQNTGFSPFFALGNLLNTSSSIDPAAVTCQSSANGQSNRKESCRHVYAAASSFRSPEEDSSSLPSEERKIDLDLPRRRLQVSFTCDACGVRSQRIINPHAYARGTVFVQCAGCEVYHKLVDNLGLIEEIDFRLETDPKVELEEAISDNENQNF